MQVWLIVGINQTCMITPHGWDCVITVVRLGSVAAYDFCRYDPRRGDRTAF